jgi:hypothetical protein
MHAIEDASARIYLLGSLHPLLAYSLENYVSVKLYVPRDRPNHACRARRASVVSNTRDRRCLCAHLLARQPTSLARLLAREVSVKLGAVEITQTTRMPRAACKRSERHRR